MNGRLLVNSAAASSAASSLAAAAACFTATSADAAAAHFLADRLVAVDSTVLARIAGYPDGDPRICEELLEGADLEEAAAIFGAETSAEQIMHRWYAAAEEEVEELLCALSDCSGTSSNLGAAGLA